MRRLRSFSLLSLVFLALLSACLPGAYLTASPATQPPNPTPQSEPEPFPPASPTPRAHPTPIATPTQTPNSGPPDTEAQTRAFPLSLPVPISNTIPLDPSYRFASTQGGLREPHHGVEFLLPFGSPVLAAGDGTVLFAGNDNNGSPYTRPNNYAFYGNFILLEHPASSLQSPVSSFYTLYAHLSEIHVQTGDTVRAGDAIGLIGFTGAALGPHLHFEVRLDGLTYADSYNPELFLDMPGRGVLIGTLLDAGFAGNPGSPIPPTALTLTPLDPAGRPVYLTTYEDPALGLRPPFNENFALALPPGTYELAFVLYGVHKQTIEIRAGEPTFFKMMVGES